LFNEKKIMNMCRQIGIIIIIGMMFNIAAVITNPAGAPAGLDVKVLNPLT
jgi:hypothetical protein